MGCAVGAYGFTLALELFRMATPAGGSISHFGSVDERGRRRDFDVQHPRDCPVSLRANLIDFQHVHPPQRSADVIW